MQPYFLDCLRQYDHIGFCLAGRYAFSLRVPANQFEIDNYPDPLNDKLTIDGKDYRVLSIEGDAIVASILINLGDATA